jgi:cysteine synthase A
MGPTRATEAAIPVNLADLIGNTPLVRLPRLAPGCGAEIVAKLEMHNPAGSVKDRIGVAMIEAAEADGRITPGRSTIVEATSGNTGIALAFVCAAKGYRLVLFMPQGMSREREGLLRLFGAEVRETESMGGMNEAVEAALAFADECPDCFRPDQFSNPANPDIHRRTTAEEIWRDTGGSVDVLVSGVGTGGTITGCGERLKELNPDIRIVAVEPKASPVLSGGMPGPHKIQGIGAGFVPDVLNLEVIDEIVAVDDEDAIETARLVCAREGILAGISAGAALAAAVEVGSRPELEGARVVAILPDSGERYVSTPFFAP